MRILIVDDSKAMRMIVRRTLRQAGLDGHEIEEAGNGVEALAAVAKAKPDVILADWNMPEMSGLDLLRELKRTGVEVKFGFVTTEGTPNMRQMAEEAGALFLITKPFTVESFRATLTPFLGQP
jgi:two-component system, chemotaxis family, chemotaxis protein CheY